MNVGADARAGQGRATSTSPRFTTAGPGHPPPRRQGLRGDDRHRPRPDARRARDAVSAMIDLLAARHGMRAGRRLHALLRLRRPADQRDRRPAELGGLLLLPAGGLAIGGDARCRRVRQPSWAGSSYPRRRPARRSGAGTGGGLSWQTRRGARALEIRSARRAAPPAPRAWRRPGRAPALEPEHRLGRVGERQDVGRCRRVGRMASGPIADGEGVHVVGVLADRWRPAFVQTVHGGLGRLTCSRRGSRPCSGPASREA